MIMDDNDGATVDVLKRRQDGGRPVGVNGEPLPAAHPAGLFLPNHSLQIEGAEGPLHR